MNALFFVLFAIVLALIILLFCKLAALSSHNDDLMDKVFKQEEELRKHTQRFEVHHKDIANNQRAIDDLKDNHIRALTTANDKLDKRLSAAERKIHVIVKDYIDSGEAPTADDTTEGTDAEDEPAERQPRKPYPPSVREMAEKFISQLLAAKGWIEKNYMPTELEWYIECRNIFLSMKSIIFRQAEKQAEQYKADKEAALAELTAKIEATEDLVARGKLESKKHEIIADINKPLSARDFNATIILMLLTPQGMLTAHIGDGRMGYKTKDGVWKALMTPHKGDEASSTVFIPNDWNQTKVPAFTMSDAYLPDVRVVHELPAAVVLMSDGCENITWSCYTRDDAGHYYDPNTPFVGFFEPLLDEMNCDLTPEARVDRLIEIINVGTRAGKSEHDDRTMLLGVFK